MLHTIYGGKMEYNTKIIDYGDYLHIQHFMNTISRVDLSEEDQKRQDKFDNEAIKTDLHTPDNDNTDSVRSLQVSVNRSKNNLYRIARSNEWEYFVTLTFRREDTNVDCSDYNQVSKCMTKWLAMIKRNYCPDLKYLAVPELHKDGIHYHFHILMGNCDNLPLKSSGLTDKLGAEIFNLPKWDYGFSTASKIKDQSKVRNYIGKYITKDLMNTLKYKKRYYCSQNVNICQEQYHLYSLQDLYDMYGEDMTFIKTITVNGLNRIQYMEIKKH